MSSEISAMEKKNNITALGMRFLRAFADQSTTNKKEIAKKLGYKSDKAIYKIVNGEQEMSFDALRRFREETGVTIDWLLAGPDAEPNKDDYISVRDLLNGIWMSEVEEKWHERNKEIGPIYFNDFLSEVFHKGFSTFEPDTAHQFYELIRGIVIDEISKKDDDTQMREIVKDIIRQENLNADNILLFKKPGVQELGAVDEFDVAAAVKRHNDPHRIITDWFLFEKQPPPEDFGVIFFEGWETFSDDEKIDALRDAKKVLDKTLKRDRI